MRVKFGLLSFVLLALLAVAAGGCGESSSTQAVETVTVTETAASDASDDQRSDQAQPEDAAGEDEPSEASEGSAEPSSGGGEVRVPNVVGKDHQLAQDTLQAAGFYNLSEEDATGQGRLLLYDRNWTVVSQSPPGGSRVSEDTTIVLRAKKDGE